MKKAIHWLKHAVIIVAIILAAVLVDSALEEHQRRQIRQELENIALAGANAADLISGVAMPNPRYHDIYAARDLILANADTPIA